MGNDLYFSSPVVLKCFFFYLSLFPYFSTSKQDFLYQATSGVVLLAAFLNSIFPLSFFDSIEDWSSI